MRDTISVAMTGKQRFIVTGHTEFRVRAAVFDGKPVLAMIDLARGVGLRAPGKAAERFDCAKIKLETRVERNPGSGVVWMLYCGLEDAMRFLDGRLPANASFVEFVRDISRELKNTPIEALAEPPAPPVQQVAQPSNGVNISERIDRLIIELLTLKQEISPTT